MKTLLPAVVMLLTMNAQAQLFSGRENYIHHETHERLELSKIDQDNQSAKYYDQATGKSKSVNLSDVSKETKETIDGVKSGNMVLVRFSNNLLRPCSVWYLYSNGLAHVGCQTGKMSKPQPISRPIVGTYTASTESMIKEVQSLDGYEKKDKVRLMRDAGDIKKGDLVRIEHIFKNGTAMIQKMGLNLVDSSGLLMKTKVQVVELKDLSLNK